MSRITLRPLLSKETLESIGAEPYRDWDETSEKPDTKRKLIEITPNENGTIPRPYSVD